MANKGDKVKFQGEISENRKDAKEDRDAQRAFPLRVFSSPWRLCGFPCFCSQPLIRRRYLTLIEIMIVMALLSMVASVVGINVYRAVNQQRYLSGAQQLANRLQTAQDIMLIANADVFVNLEQKKGWVDCRLDVQQALEPALQSVVNQAGRIDGIAAFAFIEGPLISPTSSTKLKLAFLSGGSQMSRGELIVSSGKLDDSSAIKSYILLPGYPHHIALSTRSRVDALEADLSAEIRNQNLYPTEVRAIEQERKQMMKMNDLQKELEKPAGSKK